VGLGRSCDFKTGTVILQQPVDAAQIRRLLENGRTDLLRGFVSARTRRRFSAYLVRGADGKVGFEFEPRASARAKPAASPKPGKPAARGRKKA